MAATGIIYLRLWVSDGSSDPEEEKNCTAILRLPKTSTLEKEQIRKIFDFRRVHQDQEEEENPKDSSTSDGSSDPEEEKNCTAILRLPKTSTLEKEQIRKIFDFRRVHQDQEEEENPKDSSTSEGSKISCRNLLLPNLLMKIPESSDPGQET